jgi:hypothetical protein
MDNPYGVAFAGRLFSFCESEYGVVSDQITEAHVLNFLDSCVEETVLPNGRRRRAVRRMLPQRVLDLDDYLRSSGRSLRLTTNVLAHAHALVRAYAPDPVQAVPITPETLRRLILSLDISKLEARCFKAAILTMWEAWARPTEVLRRQYPSDVCAEFDQGIALIVRSCKTNRVGPPEFFTIPHRPDQKLCAVCAVRGWLDSLRATYSGPLFPRFNKG